MIEDLLEHGRFEEAHDSGIADDVPDNARSIEGGRNGLVVIFVNANAWNSTSVFLKWNIHDLGLSSNSPYSDFTFHTSRDNLLAITGSTDGSGSVVMCVVDGKEKFSWLWKERSDLTITPSWKNWFSISCEENAVALKSWNLDSKKFLSSLGVPNSNIIHTAGGEKFWIASWESNVVDSFVVASVSQLWADVISVAPVDGGLVGSAEEVSWVSSQRNGCNCSHSLGLSLDFHILRVDLGKGSVSGTEEEISIVQQVDAVDSLGEKSSGWTDLFEEVLWKRNFNNITWLGSEESIFISSINDAASEDSLDWVHENFGILNLLLNEIAVPGSDTIVVNGQALAWGVVVELHFVGGVHANWVSN
jgi:hypothetical protein